MSVAIAVHIAAAAPALLIGLAVLALRKGTPLHKRLGRTWAGLIVISVISTIWIRSFDDSYSWIHLLSIWTAISLVIALVSIRRGNVKMHRGFMVGTYLGLLGAFAGTFAPGRIISAFLFGG